MRSGREYRRRLEERVETEESGESDRNSTTLPTSEMEEETERGSDGTTGGSSLGRSPIIGEYGSYASRGQKSHASQCDISTRSDRDHG